MEHTPIHPPTYMCITTHMHAVFLSTPTVSTFLTRLGCYHGNQTDNRRTDEPLFLPLKLPLSVFLSVFVSQVWLRCRSFTLSKQEPDHLPSCLLPSKCDVSAVRQTERERVTLIAASLSGAIILSLWHPSLPPCLYLSSISLPPLRRSLTPFAVEHNLSAINFP